MCSIKSIRFIIETAHWTRAECHPGTAGIDSVYCSLFVNSTRTKQTYKDILFLNRLLFPHPSYLTYFCFVEMI